MLQKHLTNTLARATALTKARTVALCFGLASTIFPNHALGQSAKPTQDQASQTQERSSNGATRRQLPRKPEATRPPTPKTPRSEQPQKTPENKPETKPQTPQPASQSPPTDEPQDAQSRDRSPIATFPLRGVGLRSVSFGPGFEYAWWGKLKSVTLRTFSGSSEGIRILTLPAGPKAAELPEGTKVRWQSIGAMEGNNALVSDEDFKAFQQLLPGANDPKAMHKFLATDAAAKWELQYTLDKPLQDNRAGEDWMPEIIVAFAAPAQGSAASSITIVALDAQGRETGTPISVSVADARETTPSLPLSNLSSDGSTQGIARAVLASLDMSKLGVERATSFVVRPTRSTDTKLDGTTASASAAPVPFKVMLLETAGMPLPAWAMGD
jgi:hypothetical protein